MAPPSHSLALARGIGLRREFEALITQSLPSAMGWHVVEDPAQVPYPLPFEFFPLVHTDDPIYVGVAFPTLALGGGRLARFCPPDGQYLDVFGTSGIWLAVHHIEAAKIDAPRDPEAGLRFLSQFLEIASAISDGASPQTPQRDSFASIYRRSLSSCSRGRLRERTSSARF